MQLNDLPARISNYQQAIENAVKRCINSGWLVLGPEVKKFRD